MKWIISSFEQLKTKQSVVDELNHLLDQELIIYKFAAIYGEYQALEKVDVFIRPFRVTVSSHFRINAIIRYNAQLGPA